MTNEENKILKEHILNAITEIRIKKKRPGNNSIFEYVKKKFEVNSNIEDVYAIILSLLEKNEIKNKPTKQELPSYFVVNNEIISNEDEKEDENNNDNLSFNFELLGTPPVQKVSHDTLNKSNVNNNQQSLSKKELDETAFIKESILNINAELMAIKSFVMDELYSFNKTLDRVRTEQCDQTKLIEEMKNLSNENHTKSLIIKTLSENLNTITKQQNVVNKNLNSNTNQYGNLGNSDFQYPRRSALISKRSNFTNTKEGISVSPNPYELLDHNNIQYDIADENDNNTNTNNMINPIVNENVQATKRRPHVVTNNHPENQRIFNREPAIKATVPGGKTYSEVIRNRNKSNVLRFSDSIPKGMRMYQLNKRLLNNNRAQLISFPGASSKRLLHYLDVHLEDKNTDTVILHIGVNDLLNDNSPEGVNQLMENLKSMIEKCRMYGVKNILVSSIVYTTKLELRLLESVHVTLTHFCQCNNIPIIDNRNIRGNCLYKDGLHLNEDGKHILGNNFVYVLNKLYDNNFLRLRSHHIVTN